MNISIIISYRWFNKELENNLINLLNYLSWLTNKDTDIILVEMDKLSTINWLDKIKKNQFIKHVFIEDKLTFNKFKGYNIGANHSSSNILIFNDINSYIKLNSYNFGISEINRFLNFSNTLVVPYSHIYSSNKYLTDKFISSNFNFNLYINDEFKLFNENNFLNDIFIIKKNLFLNIGGFDSNYHNNKHEEFIFNKKLKKYRIKIKNVKDSIVKLTNYKTHLPNIIDDDKIPFSIIITTKDDQDNIENCLNSIYEQPYFNDGNFEVLIGVNGCYDTLFKINKIYNRYNNLKVYMMQSEQNKSVVYNTLLDLTTHDSIITFDGCSIMTSEMINVVLENINNDIIRIKGTFNDNSSVYDDVLFYKKPIFEILGGYKDWEYLYTEDLLDRSKNMLTIKDIKKVLYKNNKISINNDIKDIYNCKIKENKTLGIININKKVSEYTYVVGNYTDKKPVSIIITAYQVKDYIEECLMSIENQKYFNNNDNYEVLIGVDHCQETLDKLLEIRHKYRNIRIFMMNENKGTYITTNTLLDIVKFDNIIRFDSDDIMRPNMISKIMSYSNDYNFIRFKYYNMKVDSNGKFTMNHHSDYAHGVVFIKKSLIDEIGGYQPWSCASDSELMVRSKELLIEKTIDEAIFYRRIHSNSLTNNLEFGFKSKNREMYRNMIGKHETIKIKRIVNGYEEL
ncbi:MAG: glycosyltransferase [Saccharofermentanales bacterium]